MTTTITPAAGAGALFTQQGTGTTPGYAALDDRRANIGNMQEGVYGTSTQVTAGGVASIASADFMVTQRGAGANQSVDVNMPAGGFAYVQGDTINGQGLYTVPVHTANINEAIAAADPTNPRVDQVILEVQDNALDASGGNQARTRVLTGTPQAGTTLATRAGAVALPGSALLLADILVPAASSSVPNSNIRDRRKWARGVKIRLTRNASTTYTTASTTPVDVDATNLKPRLECSGVPLIMTARGSLQHSVAAAFYQVSFAIDGSAPDSNVGWQFGGEAGTPTQFRTSSWETTPAAGSHLVALQFWTVTAGTLTLNQSSTMPVELVIQEDVRQVAQNSNGVTTG